ncbi:PadR family transcriptional regulator [Dactylosporangium sp. NPDC050688]|uniref:PadR family transcriptional regulator n=1 Tax=Dactylosporangium sp. NPDC050688 TaxID=3157217 RepID=UPI0033E89861
MVTSVRMTVAVAKVVAAFLADPAADRYGLDLMRVTGHPSGTLYPILLRLQRAGWVEAHWEDVDPVSAGRPARRYYRLTPDGVVTARTAVAELRERLEPGTYILPGAPGSPGLPGAPVAPRTVAGQA